jgi:hypothetical protein
MKSINNLKQTQISISKIESFPYIMPTNKYKKDSDFILNKQFSIVQDSTLNLKKKQLIHLNSSFDEEKNLEKQKIIENSIIHLRPIINRKKRRDIIRKYPLIGSLSKCNSKIKLLNIFKLLTPEWKLFIKFYMSRCFLFHLQIRQIKNTKELLQQRQNLYDALDDPDIIFLKITFSNNLVKNFCKGILNFFVMFQEQLLKNKMIPPPKKLANSKRNQKFKMDN